MFRQNISIERYNLLNNTTTMGKQNRYARVLYNGLVKSNVLY